MSIDDRLARAIMKHSRYYFPANLHYDGKGAVNCDLCRTTYIPSCLGATIQNTKYDLCLSCADRIQKTPPVPEPVKPSFKLPFTQAAPQKPTERVFTRMESDVFRPNEHVFTRMESDVFPKRTPKR